MYIWSYCKIHATSPTPDVWAPATVGPGRPNPCLQLTSQKGFVRLFFGQAECPQTLSMFSNIHATSNSGSGYLGSGHRESRETKLSPAVLNPHCSTPTHRSPHPPPWRSCGQTQINQLQSIHSWVTSIQELVVLEVSATNLGSLASSHILPAAPVTHYKIYIAHCMVELDF